MSSASAHLAEAQRLVERGLVGAARARLEEAIRADPAHYDALWLLAVVHARMRDYTGAAQRFEEAALLRPGPEVLTALGEMLRNTGRHHEALPHLRKSLELADMMVTRLALAQTLLLARQYAASIAACRVLLDPERRKRFPLSPEDEGHVLACMGMALERIGRAEEAVPCYRRAAALGPMNHFTASGLAASMNYASGIGPAEIRAAHEAYGQIVERTVRTGGRPSHLLGPAPTLKPGEPLRVGFISPDFRRHAVACFLLPLIEALYDRAAAGPAQHPLEVFLYGASSSTDTIAARFKAMANFRLVAHYGGAETAKVVAADRVHLLIECAGHTMNTRLPLMELRPAPVQALYAGYPATSGMRSVDWRIVDTVTDPPGAEANSTERLWRLDPSHLVYRPLIEAPEIEPVPPCVRAPADAADTGRAPRGVTFGSFSTVSKMTAEVVPAWARLLKEVPGSRLLLKHENMAEEGTRNALLERFALDGVADRVDIEGPEPGMAGGLMKHYAKVDIALDTFPYCGTTTVCEALWMGVPVVARPGATTVSRGSASILHAVGLGDLATPSTQAYLEAAAALARDPARLAELRRTLRERFRASPVGDYRGFADRFAAAAHGMWYESVSRARPR